MNELSLLSASLPPPTDPSARATSDEDAAKAASEVFARVLIKEITRSLPEGGLLGGSDFAPLEAIVTDALAQSLTGGDNLGLSSLFGEGVPDAPQAAGHHHVRRAPAAMVVDGTVSSDFGMRLHPITGKFAHHDGIDIAAPEGTPIHAARGGVVLEVREAPGYGNLVVVDHGNGLHTRYAHCSTIDVAVGDRVARGDTIAKVGQTGRSTGPHLHFEVRRNGRALDPAPWIREGTAVLTRKAKAPEPVVDRIREDPGI